MKKLYIALISIFIFAAISHADFRQFLNGREYPPAPNTWDTEALYISSSTCADNSASGSQVVISTSPAYFFGVTITSGGLGSPTVQLFDSSVSTSGVRWVTPPIDARNINLANTYNIMTSSGLTMRSSGSQSAPCIAVSYAPR